MPVFKNSLRSSEQIYPIGEQINGKTFIFQMKLNLFACKLADILTALQHEGERNEKRSQNLPALLSELVTQVGG